MLIDLYPTIKKATIEIAYDNGAVHRGRTEQDVLNSVEPVLRSKLAHQLEAAERELAGLSPDDLETLCCGEQGVVDCSDLTEELLTDIFENI